MNVKHKLLNEENNCLSCFGLALAIATCLQKWLCANRKNNI